MKTIRTRRPETDRRRVATGKRKGISMNSAVNAVRTTIFFFFIVLFGRAQERAFAAEQPADSSTRPVAGKVFDRATGQPVADALVSTGAPKRTVSSDRRGAFKIDIPSGFPCTLTVTKAGYGQSSVPVEPGTNNAFVEIDLEPSSLPELPKLVVNTGRTKQPIMTSGEIGRIELSPELAGRLPTAGQPDLFRSLQLLPGVNGTNETSSGLFIQGGTPDQNLILLDNMPVYYVDHFYGFFSAFNPRAIDNLTLHKGGFGAKWGGHLSSVVELSSSGRNKKSDPGGIEAELGTGLLCSDGFLKIPFAHDTIGTLMLAGRRSMTDFFRTGLFDNLFRQMHDNDTMNSRYTDKNRPWVDEDHIVYQPDFHFWDVNGLAAFNLGSRGRLAATFFASHDYQDNSIDTTWSIRTIEPVIEITYLPGDKKQYTVDTLCIDTITATTEVRNRSPVSWGNICIGQEWKQKWSDAFTTGLNLSYSRFVDTKTEDYSRTDSKTERFSDTTSPTDSVFGNVSWMTSENRIVDLTGRFDNSVKFTEGNLFRAGVEVSRKNVLYTRDTMPTDTASLEWKYRYVWEQQPPIRSNDTGIAMGVYAEDEMNFNDKAGITPGVRFNYFRLASKSTFDPRISGWWNLLPEVKVKGAWGIYTQEIHRVEQEDISGGGKYIWLLSNKNRTLEKSHQIIGGISWKKRHFLFDVEGYYKRMSGLLTISERMRSTQFVSRTGLPFDPTGLVLFEGTGLARGIELLAQIRNVRFPLFSRNATYDGWAAYTWSRVENTYAVFNDGNPFPASQDHPHEVKLVNSLEWKIAAWSSINLGAVWLYSTGTPYTAPLGTYTLTTIDSASDRSYMLVSDRNAFRLPDYHRLDLSVSWKVRFGSHVKGSLTLGLFNAYNRENILERSYTATTVGDIGSEISGIESVVFTKIDRKAMAAMPNAALELSAEF